MTQPGGPDLDALMRELWRDPYCQGYQHGHDDGYAAGYAACDEEISALQRAAVRNLHAAAELPARDREADRARRVRVEAKWAAKRTRRRVA